MKKMLFAILALITATAFTACGKQTETEEEMKARLTEEVKKEMKEEEMKAEIKKELKKEKKTVANGKTRQDELYELYTKVCGIYDRAV